VGEEDRAARMNERLKGISSKSSTEAYAGDSGISHVHTQVDLV
jgi:hypothetical protein